MGAMAGTLVGGLFGAYGAYKQAKATDKAVGIQREQLAFQRQRYEDWKKVFGSLSQDLGTYYKNLNGRDLSNLEIQQIEEAYTKSVEKIQQNLAQRGISGSGIEASLLAQNEFNKDLAEARSAATADMRVASEKEKFLSLGYGQGQSIASSANSVSANLSNALLSQGKAQANLYNGLGAFTTYFGNMYKDKLNAMVNQDPTQPDLF